MKCVPVHHGIPAVLHRDEPWLHRHSENGALDIETFKAFQHNLKNRFFLLSTTLLYSQSNSLSQIDIKAYNSLLFQGRV